ncbi:Protein kinase-like domain [Cordyceps militaris CM01]|uniref:Protein kinase-like domain n=1 Tax=Cordyceps militaris (strain CM01) TaxID=983644 RepID=G3JUR5_CORMM|nr:Protein kinase-like domain [Cordyceps militaris CM01]EGX87865.1 Protein kinase-like domain [Cordyceps militaris CM01]
MRVTSRSLNTVYPLFTAYKQFTHGGNFWRDEYLLEQWDRLIQPVIYRDNTYHGYKLLRRLGSCDFLTVKFLPRDGNNELAMCKYIQKNCTSPFVSTIRDHFVIPHHLHNTSQSRFENVSFQAIVYPTTGICMGRVYDALENHDKNPNLPLTLERRRKYIGQIVQGMSELHRIGVVHADNVQDLHPGNIALDAPSKDDMTRLLATPPAEDDVRLHDDSLPPPWMPCRSTEPEDIGFSPSGIKIIDFGFSFISKPGALYTSDDFPPGNPAPPELLVGDKSTNQPFKADSWYLGQTMYFILTGGGLLFRRSIGCNDEGLLEEVVYGLDALRSGQKEIMNELPQDVKDRYMPIILGLLEFDPVKRLAILDIKLDD